MAFRIVVRTARVVALTAILGLAPGCAARGVDEPATHGAYQLRVVNEGPIALRSLVIHTSERDALRVGMLSPGASVSFDGIGAIHDSPRVSATLSGRVVELTPVEGFSGFNPRLAAGAYVMTLRAEPDGRALSVQLRPL